MAKLQGVPRILKEVFPKEVQAWIDTLISPLNETLGSVYNSLKNKLTFSDNFLSSIKEFEFTHGVELILTHGLPLYAGILIIKTPDDSLADTAIASWKVRTITNSKIGVTINFAGAGTTTGKVKFIILGA